MGQSVRVAVREPWFERRIVFLIAFLALLLAPRWAKASGEKTHSERPAGLSQECRHGCDSASPQSPFFDQAMADLLDELPQRPLPGMEWEALTEEQRKNLELIIRGYERRERTVLARLKTMQGAIERYELVRGAVPGELQDVLMNRDRLAELISPSLEPEFLRLNQKDWAELNHDTGRTNGSDLLRHLDELGEILGTILVRLHVVGHSAPAEVQESKALAAVLLTDAYVLSALASNEALVADKAAGEHLRWALASLVGYLGGELARGLGLFDVTSGTDLLGAVTLFELGIFVFNVRAGMIPGGVAALASRRARNAAQGETFQQLTQRFWNSVSQGVKRGIMWGNRGAWFARQMNSSEVKEHSLAVWHKVFGVHYPADPAQSLTATLELLQGDLGAVSARPISLDRCQALLRTL